MSSGAELAIVACALLLACAYCWWAFVRGERRARQLARTRHDLAVTDERYRSLFEHNPNAVFSVDRAGRLTSANRAAEELTGRPVSELLGLDVRSLVPADRMEQAMATFGAVLSGEPQYRQTEILGAGGVPVEIEFTALPIMENDELVGVYAIASDIRGRKRLERDLMRAQVEAEQASGAKDLLLANVSHEVRTPLTGLLGNLELLSETDLDAEQAAFVGTMTRSGDRLLALVNEILDYTRLEAGKVVLARVPFDLSLVVSEVVGLVGETAANKGLYFKRKVATDLPEELVGDPARVAQILTILVENAVKFTDEGWVRLEVAVVRREEGQASIRFEVSDSGIGMPTRHRDQLFQAFSQADPSMTRRHGGTGLGLTRCHQLVTMMGGSISVDSTPGMGSAFTFALTFEEAVPRAGGVARHSANSLIGEGDRGPVP